MQVAQQTMCSFADWLRLGCIRPHGQDEGRCRRRAQSPLFDVPLYGNEPEGSALPSLMFRKKCEAQHCA